MEGLVIGSTHPRVPVGRESELAEVERFPSAGSEAPHAFVLSGEPGIGKTTLWEAGIESARARGFTALIARASEAEAQLSFAGLADLLDGVDLRGLEGLPGPQLSALEAAVRRAESSDQPSDSFAISAGLLGVLRRLTERERLLIAIDDLPWLDLASATALLFAARRLAGCHVRFLVSRRAGPTSELEHVLEPQGVVRLDLGPLSFGAISRLLSDRLGRSLPRRVLRQLHETSGGNPLFALELGRALIERGLPEIGAALPVPERLDALFSERVAALRPDVRGVLLALALSGGLRREELAAVVDPLALEDAQTSGVLIIDGTHVRASHPLLAAAALAASSARDRRDLHGALALAVGDQVLRANHLAMAAFAPDAELAAQVSAVAAHAIELGAVQEAAVLAGHALRLTPSGDRDHDGRLLAVAEFLYSAGEYHRATALLEARIDTLRSGAARAAAHLLLGEGAEFAAQEQHLEHAIAESADDPGMRARAIAKRALLLALMRVARIGDAEASVLEALSLGEATDRDTERRVLVALAWARVMRGRPIDDLMQRTTGTPITSSLYESSVERPAGVRLAFRGELELARGIFRRLLASADERGEALSGAVLVMQMCEVELRAGDTREVARLLDEWGQWAWVESEGSTHRSRVRALLAALRGEPEPAAELAETVLEASERNPGLAWDRLEALRATGLVALFERDPERACASLGRVWDHTVRQGVDDPGAFPVAGDFVEALAESGRLDAARNVIARLRGLARDQQHPWGLATSQRSAAVVELVDHYDHGAAGALASAAAGYRELGLGFEHARAMLFLGRVQRRFKKRSAARESLGRAAGVFEQLGCLGWAGQARSELARVSGRRPAHDGGLTPSEQRVAELVASGLSNKEVAARLFVSVYTVEAHLSSVYAKLGIRSRTQLTARLTDTP